MDVTVFAGSLSPQMEFSGPKGIEGGAHLKHLRISGVISGRPIAVLFSQNVAALRENKLKEDISSLTAIHTSRLMVFRPDGTMFEDARIATVEKDL